MPPKTAPTHFLCIPLTGTQLSRSLASFKADVTNPMSFAVPPEAIRPLGTLHLTLGVMALKGDGVERAAELLRSLRLRDMLANMRKSASSTGSSSVTDDTKLSVTLQGLQAMHTPSKTSVVYAPPVDTDGVLWRFCEQIKTTFQEAGLMAEENRPLLLHATIVNTIYVKSSRGKRRERLTIDARDMVSQYDGHVWMENMPVERLTLCRMGAKKIEGTDDEAYEVEVQVEF